MTEPTPQERSDKIAVKIGKLLAQAEDAAKAGRSDEEQAFQIKAFTLLAQYGLSEATARAALDGHAAKVEVKAEYIYQVMEGKYKPVQATFFYHFAEALHCKSILVGGRQGNVTVQVFGVPDHLRRVQMMWKMLQPQLMRGMSKAEPPFGYSHSGELRTYRRNWVLGFQHAVVERVREAEKTEAAKVEGALVLYKSDQDLAVQAHDTAYPKTRQFRSKIKYNSSAYDNGHRAGKSAVLQHQVGE